MSLMPSISSVMKGRAFFCCLKMPVTRGMTKLKRSRMSAEADEDHDGGVGHGADDLGAELDLGVHEVGEAVEDDVEVTARLTGADHVDVEVGEDLGVLGEGGGEGGALVDLVFDGGEDGLEGRGSRLGR
jgi:hypothetical protein